MTSLTLPAVLALAWIAALLFPSSRNRRFIVALALWTVLMSAASQAPPNVRPLLAALLIAICAYAIARPSDFVIGSLTHAEERADDMLRRVWVSLQSADGPPAIAKVDGQTDPRWFPPGDWRLAARLVHCAVATLSGQRQTSSIPASTFVDAGVAYWNRAHWHRILWGRPRGPSPYQEEVLLRCYQEEFNDLMSFPSLGEGATTATGAWTEEAETLIAELRAASIRDTAVRDTRAALLGAMTAHLAVAHGDRSAVALDRRRESQETLAIAWTRLAAQDEGSGAAHGGARSSSRSRS